MKLNKLFLLVACILIILYFIKLPIKEGVSFREQCLVDGIKRNNFTINRDKKILTKNNDSIKYDTNFNSINGSRNCNDKIKTALHLRKENIPMPKEYIWNRSLSNSKNLYKINQLKYPLVVKPNKGTQGYGVTTNIKNQTELIKVINKLLNKTKNTDKQIIVEEHYNGDNYRVMVLNNEVIGIVRRDNPYVIGDGKSSLQKLISQHKQSKHNIHEYDVPYIKKQGYDLNSIIPNNKKIIVSKVQNYHNGAPIHNISIDNVHPDNINMFKKTAEVLDVNLTGIDYMTNNLMTPYYEDGVIIEANERPDIAIHCDSVNAKQRKSFIDKFLNSIFQI